MIIINNSVLCVYIHKPNVDFCFTLLIIVTVKIVTRGFMRDQRGGKKKLMATGVTYPLFIRYRDTITTRLLGRPLNRRHTDAVDPARLPSSSTRPREIRNSSTNNNVCYFIFVSLGFYLVLFVISSK